MYVFDDVKSLIKLFHRRQLSLGIFIFSTVNFVFLLVFTSLLLAIHYWRWPWWSLMIGLFATMLVALGAVGGHLMYLERLTLAKKKSLLDQASICISLLQILTRKKGEEK